MAGPFRSLAVFAIGLTVIVLTSCGEAPEMAPAPEDVSYNSAAMYDEPASRARNDAAQSASIQQDQSLEPNADTDNQPSGMLLAYRYDAQIRAPAPAVSSVMEAHEQACVAAGPRRCVVFGSSITSRDDYAEGALSIRAAPDWLEEFRNGLAGDAEDAGGRLLSMSTSVEDLTRQIVDTEARERALITLRDRLQSLLENEPGEIDDLLKVERELARTQGELDAAKSRLTVMRQRVDMSELTIRYVSERNPVRRSAFSPFFEAIGMSVEVFMTSLGALLLFIVGAAPFAIALIPVVWLIRRWWRSRRARRHQHGQDPAPIVSEPPATTSAGGS